MYIYIYIYVEREGRRTRSGPAPNVRQESLQHIADLHFIAEIKRQRACNILRTFKHFNISMQHVAGSLVFRRVWNSGPGAP